jgi:hypothetical protein
MPGVVTIRKSGSASVSGTVEVLVSHENDSIKIGDGTDLVALQDEGGTKCMPVKVFGGGAGGTAMEDGDAFTAGTTSITPVGGLYDANESDTVADGVTAAIGINNLRHVKVAVQSIAAGDNNIGNVDIVSSALPTGAATSAKQDTMITALQIIDNLATALTSDGSDSIDVNIIGGAGSGGTAVADGAAFTAGTTSITPVGGLYDANESDTVTDGDTAAIAINNLRHVKVAVHSIAAGDNNIGNVDVASSALPTGASTLAEQQSQTTHLATLAGAIRAEDVASANGHTGIVAMATRKDTPANVSGTDGDYEMLQMSAGRLWTSSTIDAALPAGTNAIGKLAANSGVDIGDVDVTSVTCAAANAKVDVALLNGAAMQMGNGTASTGTLRVAIASDNTANSNPWLVAGGVAHDAADGGNPIKVGGKARTTNPTAVADADRVDATFDDLGRQVVVLNQVRDLVVHQTTTITASTTETTILSAAASTFHDLTSLIITNSSSTALIVTLKDATAGTTRAIYALAANGGIVVNFPTPLTQATVNNNWTLTCGTSVSSIYVQVVAVKNV